MDLPVELIDFVAMLDEGTVQPLRQRATERIRLRSALTRFSDRVYFFPFGIQPNLDQPVTVFLNGMVQMQDEDFVLLNLGTRLRVVAVVFDETLSELDTVQAQYDNTPPL